MNNTSTSAPSRRGLFQGAAAAAVAAGIGVSDAIAGGSLHSPEFTEWQRLAMKARDWFASVRDGHITATQENEAAIDRLWDRMSELEEVIFKMPVRSVEDVMVLGIIALNWNADEAPGTLFLDGNILGLRDKEATTDEKSRGYLIRAVCMLAKATGQIPALADSNFDLSAGT